MKKIYVAPKIRVINSCSCNILTTSNKNAKRYAYHCPYIPETECELYDDFVMRKIGANKGFLKATSEGKPFMSVDLHCPYKSTCEDYDLYRSFINDKQR